MVVSNFGRAMFSCPCELAKSKPRVFGWVHKVNAGSIQNNSCFAVRLFMISPWSPEVLKNFPFRMCCHSKIGLQNTFYNNLLYTCDFHPLCFQLSRAFSLRPYIKDCVASSFIHTRDIPAGFLSLSIWTWKVWNEFQKNNVLSCLPPTSCFHRCYW